MNLARWVHEVTPRCPPPAMNFTLIVYRPTHMFLPAQLHANGVSLRYAPPCECRVAEYVDLAMDEVDADDWYSLCTEVAELGRTRAFRRRTERAVGRRPACGA